MTDDASAITMPHSMADWFKKAGYTDVINETNVFFHKDDAQAKRASSLYSKGYKVCLFINMNMLYASDHDKGSATPDHWVVLLSEISVASTAGKKQVKLTVQSWGKVRNVPQSSSLSLESFLKNYYGFVACKN